MFVFLNKFRKGAVHRACSFGQLIAYAGLIPLARGYTQIVMRECVA